jgi:hypothetical protein
MAVKVLVRLDDAVLLELVRDVQVLLAHHVSLRGIRMVDICIKGATHAQSCWI